MAGSVEKKSIIELKKLAEHREAILLAELAAWLHDWQKCIDMAIASQWKKNKNVDKSKIKEWLERSKILNPGDFANILNNKIINLFNEKINIKTLIELGREPSKASFSKWFLVKILGKVHDIAHIEKELELHESQEYSTDWLSSAFGWELNQPEELLSKLIYNLKIDLIKFFENKKSRADLIKSLKSIFNEAWGDTRRPINEVTLWDWSSIVAALFKSEITRTILLNEHREPQNIKWRLLNIRFDGLSFLFKNAQIPDLLARRDLLNSALNNVQTLLEETYPLGLEVYRDENGSLFVIPDIENLLELAVDTNKNNLYQLILNTFNQGTVKDNPCLSIEGELVPLIEISKTWNGIDKSLPPVDESLKKTLELEADPNKVLNWWCSSKPEELCTVCGLRPQGPDPKAKSRNVCNVCEERREDRSQEWIDNLGESTIWLNEIADVNGRYALLVGAFDLEKWLLGKLVHSLAVRNPENEPVKSYEKIAKNPSFARIRRIWDTTWRFWQEVLPTDKTRNIKDSLVAKVLEENEARLAWRGNITDGKGKHKTPGYFHAYELVTEKGYKINVVWDAHKKRFVSADNLIYIARIIGKNFPKKKEGETNEEYKKRLKGWALAEIKRIFQGKLKIEEPSGYGGISKEFGTIESEGMPEVIEKSEFVPAIPILAEPKIFMAVFPANKALNIVRAIKTKYEREMGKVRNRLPLHLGIVYTHRRTPLRAVLDAGQRMLQQFSQPMGWKVTAIEEKNIDNGDQLPQRFDTDRNGQFKKWYEISLERNGSLITWFVPALMGDGKTVDNWYPYVFLESLSESIEDGKRYYEAPNPWRENEKNWLILAGDLKKGDNIYFTPSTFDFEWLDTAVRRFEITYDEIGLRKERITRPYLLDELHKLDEIWDTLSSHLTKNQIYAIRDIIEDRRKTWQPDENNLKGSDGLFWKFCRDVIINALWQKGKKGHRKNKTPWEVDGINKTEWLNIWATFAARGWLTDVVELHLHIMKEKLKTEHQEQEVTS